MTEHAHEFKVNQIIGANADVDEDGIAYVTLTVTATNAPGETVELRMNAAQAGITASTLQNAEQDAEDLLEDAGLGKRSLDAISPAYPPAEQ